MHTAQNKITLDLPAATLGKLEKAAKAANMTLETYAAALLTRRAAAGKEVKQ